MDEASMSINQRQNYSRHAWNPASYRINVRDYFVGARRIAGYFLADHWSDWAVKD